MIEDEPKPEEKPQPKVEIVPAGQDPITKKFLPGNRLSVGHKPTEAIIARRELHKAFLAAVGPVEFRAVLDRHLHLIQTAHPRDAAKLIELLYVYCLGKPTETVTLDVSTNQPAAAPLILDDADIAALETIRRKHQSTDQGDD